MSSLTPVTLVKEELVSVAPTPIVVNPETLFTEVTEISFAVVIPVMA